MSAHQLQRARGVIRHGDVIPFQAKGASERGERIRVVVDDEQMAQAFPPGETGSSITNVAPLPGVLITDIFPP